MSTELVERLNAGIRYLPRMATEDSAEYRNFCDAGDAISVIEGDLWNALFAMREAADELTALTAKVHDVEASNTRLLSLIADIREASGVGALHELPLVIDRIVDERDVATAKVALLTEALRPFDGLATVVLSEAPPNADFIIVYTDSTGWAWAMRLDDLRAARRALSEPDKDAT